MRSPAAQHRGRVRGYWSKQGRVPEAGHLRVVAGGAARGDPSRDGEGPQAEAGTQQAQQEGERQVTGTGRPEAGTGGAGDGGSDPPPLLQRPGGEDLDTGGGSREPPGEAVRAEKGVSPSAGAGAGAPGVAYTGGVRRSPEGHNGQR